MADTLKTLSLDEQFEQMKDVTFEDAFASFHGGVQIPQQTPEQVTEQQSETLLPNDIPAFSASGSVDEGNPLKHVDDILMGRKEASPRPDHMTPEGQSNPVQDFLADPPRVTTRQGANPLDVPQFAPGLITPQQPTEFNRAAQQAANSGADMEDMLKALQELPDKIVRALRDG